MSLIIEILPPSDRRSRLAVPKAMREWLINYAIEATRRADVLDGQWTMHLVNDQHMMQYHQKTMGLGTTTDVLTFDYSDDLARPVLLELETIICVDEARRQAVGRSHPLEYELLLYAIHSLLHCLGYDDQTRRGALRMHRREDAILREIGLPRVYFSTQRSGTSTDVKRDGGRKASSSAKPAIKQRGSGGRG
jgi:probable rRNA maturation factor